MYGGIPAPAHARTRTRTGLWRHARAPMCLRLLFVLSVFCVCTSSRLAARESAPSPKSVRGAERCCCCWLMAQWCVVHGAGTGTISSPRNRTSAVVNETLNLNVPLPPPGHRVRCAWFLGVIPGIPKVVSIIGHKNYLLLDLVTRWGNHKHEHTISAAL